MEYMESKMQDHYESSNSWLEEFEQLKAERDALAAQVERLTPLARRCIWGVLVWNDHNFGDLRGCLKEETNKVGILDIDEANRFLAATPQQCLAEIRAEAGRAGFVVGADTYFDRHYDKSADEEVMLAADQYASKIRNTGTWLKDSNVNGGKRQGGE